MIKIFSNLSFIIGRGYTARRKQINKRKTYETREVRTDSNSITAQPVSNVLTKQDICILIIRQKEKNTLSIQMCSNAHSVG